MAPSPGQSGAELVPGERSLQSCHQDRAIKGGVAVSIGGDRQEALLMSLMDWDRSRPGIATTCRWPEPQTKRPSAVMSICHRFTSGPSSFIPKRPSNMVEVSHPARSQQSAALLLSSTDRHFLRLPENSALKNSNISGTFPFQIILLEKILQ